MGSLNINNKAPSLVELDGIIDGETAPMFKDKVKSMLSDGQCNIVCDCSKLNSINCDGIGVFTVLLGKIQEKEGSLELVNVKEELYEYFDMLGFTKLFKISKNNHG